MQESMIMARTLMRLINLINRVDECAVLIIMVDGYSLLSAIFHNQSVSEVSFFVQEL